MRDDWSTLRKLMFQRMAAGGRLIEDTVTGNPAVFKTNVAKPLTGFTIPFLPVQSGTGDPSPQNQRPIIGWSVVNAGIVNGTAPEISNNARMENVNGVWQNILTDSKTKFDAYVQLYKGSTYIKNAGSKSITEPGVYSISFTVDNNTCDRIVLLHSGSINNISIRMPFNLPVGDYIISFNVLSVNPSTIGGLKLRDIFLTAGSDLVRQSYPVTFPALGKNLLDPSVRTAAGNSVRYYRNTEEKLLLKAGQTYTLSATARSSQMAFFDLGNHALASTYSQSLTYTPTEDVYVWIDVFIANGDIPEGGISSVYCQLEKGSSPTDYEPYTNAVYGGTLDAVSWVLTVEWAYANLNSESAWGSYGTGDGFLVYVTKSDMQVGNRLSGYCDMFPSTFSQTGANIRFGADDNVIRIYNINTLGITDLSEWKEFIGTDGINICYPLATPYEIQLDPLTISTLTISTLIGDNTIWTDTNGSNTIKYKKKG